MGSVDINISVKNTYGYNSYMLQFFSIGNNDKRLDMYYYNILECLLEHMFFPSIVFVRWMKNTRDSIKEL